MPKPNVTKEHPRWDRFRAILAEMLAEQKKGPTEWRRELGVEAEKLPPRWLAGDAVPVGEYMLALVRWAFAHSDRARQKRIVEAFE